MDDSEKKKRITDIQTLYRNCNVLSEQKCNLASQAYELVRVSFDHFGVIYSMVFLGNANTVRILIEWTPE